jgi:D-serine deaminase-like pyridoxal phosphate-dependent protein
LPEILSCMNLTDLPTPCLILDRPRMMRNIHRLRSHVGSLGCILRPHVKTAKCKEVALAMSGGAPGPITVSTLKEAEQFFAAGFTDILYAVGLAPHKLAQVIKLRQAGCDLKIVLDNVMAANAVAQAARDTRTATGELPENSHGKGVFTIPTLIEIDCDGHRSGLKPGNPVILEVAAALGDNLAGVLTHAGDSYYDRTPEAKRAAANAERDAVVQAARLLREAGHACGIVSVGSTPTATHADNLAGVTEVRAGVFVFMDLVMAGIGVCPVDDIALSVQVTVIGHQRDKGWVITDGGWMAMSRDRGTAKQAVDQGYGLVCDAEGRLIDGLWMNDANQEHGIVSYRNPQSVDIVAQFPVGSSLRILPNHACATGAQHDRYYVSEGGHSVTEVWSRFSGW